jgi:ribose-phosphate pyrophosphokinase
MLVVLPGSANPRLASAVADSLGLRLGDFGLSRHPDGEQQLLVRERLQGASAYIVQPASPPAGEHLLELLLFADACRRAGARSVTAVVPYLAYARQDRHDFPGQPLGARVVADLISSRVDRCIVVDLHAPAVEGCFSVPVEDLTALPLLTKALLRAVRRPDVVVAADAGAVKRAQRCARELSLPVAIVQRTRPGRDDLGSVGIIGEVRGLRPLIVDDMIATGATLEGAVRALRAQGCAEGITALATHALLDRDAARRLASLSLERVVVADTVPIRPEASLDIMETVSIAALLADEIRALEPAEGQD